MSYRRVYLVILDGVGIGAAPDAAEYGDTGSDTLAHTLTTVSVELPKLKRLGLGNLYYGQSLPRVEAVNPTQAHYARLTEVSQGKDTTTGHWELMGVVRETAAPTFPDGFPAEFIKEFSNRTGRGVLGNRPASGTAVINDLGKEHQESGRWIVYTSADSVFQLAAHVDTVPLDELYAACETAREMLNGELAVDRVIARPFTGPQDGKYYRTPDRRDYSLPPPSPTTLDAISKSGLEVIGIGKISDIFAGQGLTQNFPLHGNEQMMKKMTELAQQDDWEGLLFCNLVDFDMLFGHRNDPEGLADALADFDVWLSLACHRLNENELLIITADHGNDPTTPSTDHSREQVPVLIYSRDTAEQGGQMLTAPPGFFHVGKTIATALGVPDDGPGVDLLSLVQ